MQTDVAQTRLFSEQEAGARLHVIGVGDAGCRAASETWRRRLNGVAVTCVDTDALSLERSFCDRTVLLGAASMHGFGSGGDEEAVAKAAVSQCDEAVGDVDGAACVVVIAGLSGGTGSAAAPVIAAAARRKGALVIGVPVLPLEFEPIGRHLAAADSLREFREACDGVLELPERAADQTETVLQKLFAADRGHITAFASAVSTVVNSSRDRCEAGQGDLRAVLHDGSTTVFGSGTGIGHVGAFEATQTCLDAALARAEGGRAIERAVLLIESGPDITVSHVATITSLAESRLGPDVELRAAVRRSRLLGDRVRVSVIGAIREKRRAVAVDPVAVRGTINTRVDEAFRLLTRQPVAVA